MKGYANHIIREMFEVEREFDIRPGSRERHEQKLQAMSVLLGNGDPLSPEELFRRLRSSRLDGFKIMRECSHGLLALAENLRLNIHHIILYCLIAGLEKDNYSGVSMTEIAAYVDTTVSNINNRQHILDSLCVKGLVRKISIGGSKDSDRYLTVRN